MYRVLECLMQEHDWRLVAVAALVCGFGAVLSARMTRGVMGMQGLQRRLKIYVTGILLGATIWSTHFLAMLAYDPGLPDAYEPFRTATSLLVAILGAGAALGIFTLTKAPKNVLLGGLFLGLTISAMHYMGMSALLLPGEITFDPVLVTASIALGSILGATGFHRLAYPKTRFCWLGGGILLMLAICAMHFTGMGAVEIRLSPMVTVPERALSDATLASLVFAVTGLLIFIGFTSLSIEQAIQREAQRSVERSATHDMLTGLPNRVWLSDRLEQLSDRMFDHQHMRVGILVIDLNKFKEINDLHGHAAGDTVLKTLAQRLSAACLTHEHICRTGGDEFVAIKTHFRREAEVVAFANRLLAVFSEEVSHGDLSFQVGGSIGIATTIEHGSDVHALMQKADLAMYRAKRDAVRNISMFDASMDDENRERLALLHDLRQAAGRNQLSLVYQLQTSVENEQVLGFEALLRWHHPVRGTIPPSIFIPLAEESGVIRELGAWVLRTACFEASQWPDPHSIAINVAPQQLTQPGFDDLVSNILKETGLDPARLELEITEASVIDDEEHAFSVMHKLKALGVRIAMDDFGTGYSSLATLQAFPYDKIKVDRAFVEGLHKDARRAAIVEAAILIGKAIDVPVLAEGVETCDELAFLRRTGLNSVQGFLFGKPMAVDELRAFLSRPQSGLRTAR